MGQCGPRAVQQIIKQSLTAFYNIPPGRIEVAGVPWVGYFSGAACKIHQKVHFVGKVATTDLVHTPDIGVPFSALQRGAVRSAHCSGIKNVRINETLLFQRGQHLILTGKFRYLFVQLNDIQAPEHSAVADRQETDDHLGEDWLSMVLEVIVS